MVAGIPGIPENERDCYLGVALETLTTNPNQRLTSWWFQIFFIFIPTWGNDPI